MFMGQYALSQLFLMFPNMKHIDLLRDLLSTRPLKKYYFWTHWFHFDQLPT
jgi:hypothetical protein